MTLPGDGTTFTRRRNRSLLTRARRATERFLHHPVVEALVVLLITLSVLLLVLETAYADQPFAWQLGQAGNVLTGVFAVELLLRYWVANKKSRFFQRYWIDIVAVLPLARPLRFFRVLRILRLFRAGLLLNRRLSVFRGVFQGTSGEILILTTTTLVIVLVSAFALHLAEGEQNAAFSELDGAVWFAVYSLIGGEPIGGEPVTPLGRWVTLGVMMSGLTVFGMFVGTVSASMVNRLSRVGLEVHEMDLDELEGHVLICGWNRAGPTVLRELFHDSRQVRPVVLVTEGEGMPEDVPTDGIRRELVYYVSGDYTRLDVLEEVGTERAAVAILLTDGLSPRSDQDRDARTVLAALTIERLNPGIFTCAELTNRQNEALLRMAGVEEIIVGDWYAGVILGSVSRNRGLVQVLDEILSTEHGNAFHKTRMPRGMAGKTVGELFTELKSRHQAILVSIEARDEGKVQVNPDSDMVLQGDETLVVICRGSPRW